jgi:hypothetical protein
VQDLRGVIDLPQNQVACLWLRGWWHIRLVVGEGGLGIGDGGMGGMGTGSGGSGLCCARGKTAVQDCPRELAPTLPVCPIGRCLPHGSASRQPAAPAVKAARRQEHQVASRTSRVIWRIRMRQNTTWKLAMQPSKQPVAPNFLL